MLFLIWADQKYSNQKNPSVVFPTPKNPGVFHRPKKIPFGQNVRPKNILHTPPPPPSPVIKICEWGPWGFTLKLWNDLPIRWTIWPWNEVALNLDAPPWKQRTWQIPSGGLGVRGGVGPLEIKYIFLQWCHHIYHLFFHLLISILLPNRRSLKGSFI